MSAGLELPDPLWQSTDTWYASLGSWFHEAYRARLNNRPGEVWANILAATTQAIDDGDRTAAEAIEFAHLLCVRDFHDGGLLLRCAERARCEGRIQRAAILCALVGAQKVRVEELDTAVEYFRDALVLAAEAKDILVDLVVGDCFGDYCQMVGRFDEAERAYALAFRDSRLYGYTNTRILLELNRCVIKLAVGEVAYVAQVLERMRSVRTAGRVADLYRWVELLYETSGRARGPGARSEELRQSLLERQLATNWSLGSNVSPTTPELVEFARREYELQALADHTDVGMCLVGEDGRLRLCNARFASAYGFDSPIEVEGRPFSTLFASERATMARVDHEWVLASHEATTREIEREDDPYPGTILVESFPVRDSHGEVFAVGTFEIDISARKQVEAQLRAYENSRTLAELTSRVAHDVNNVLAVILGNLELLESSEGRGRWRERVNACSEAVRQGSALTRNLLSLSGRQPIELARIDLDEVLRSVQALFEAAATERHHFVFDLDSRAEVTVDQSRMLNALVNLVVNARDAMTEPGTIVLGTRAIAGGNWVELFVEDQGPGIPESLRTKVLEPFFTTKPRGVGTGLGLAMVRAFAEQAHGSIALEDAEPGCRIIVTIPTAQGERSGTEPAPQGPDRSSAPESFPGPAPEEEQAADQVILLVDDNTQMLEVLGGVLRKTTGIGTVDCRSFAEVDERVSIGGVPQFALVDLALPDSDGISVAQWLREYNPDVGIVLMSGNAAEADRERAASAGFMTWLSKPFSLAQLGTALSASGCTAGAALLHRFRGRS